MTDHLGLGRIAAGMDVDALGAKSNDVDGGLDAALTNPGTFAIDATNARTLTAAEMIGNVGFKFTAGGATAACTVTVPATNAEAATLRRGFFAVINDTGFDLTVTKVAQAEPAPTLAAGQRSILYYDGDNVYLAVPQGAIGADGVSAGVRWKFDTSTTTADDPGAGDLRLNNATLASVTEVGISDSAGTTGNPDASGWLATFDDSTAAVKGQMIITKASAPENFAIYDVTAATDATTHWRFTVTHVDSAGSFSAADNLAVQFVPKGNVGAGSTVAIEEDGVSVMASAETINFTGGVTVTDAGGGQVDVDISGGTFSGALVKKAADQTGADYTTFTPVAWNAESYDDDGWHDNATNNTRLTVPANVSKVEVEAQINALSVTNDTSMVLRISKNGSIVYDGYAVIVGNINNSGPSLRVATPAIEVTPSVDYFEAELYIEGDASVTIVANGSWFAIKKVA